MSKVTINQSFFVLFFFLFFVCHQDLAAEASPAKQNPSSLLLAKRRSRAKRIKKPVIRRIHISQVDIFDTSVPSENKFIYRLVNSLHATTKKRIIKRQLLFKPRDRYDPRIAKETERALRHILRLRSVKVTPVPVNRKSVDVFVRTQETWTTEPTLSLSGVGSDVSGKIGIRERNLFGYGKHASYFYKTNNDIISRSFSYEDPDFLHTRLKLDGNYVDSEDGTRQSVSLERPFYSSITPWATELFASSQEQQIRIFDEGRETTRLFEDRQEYSGSLSFSLWSTTRLIRRIKAGYHFKDEKFTEQDAAGALLKSNRYQTFSLGLHLERIDFLTMDHIKKYDRDEDFNMGPSVVMSAGFSRDKWVRQSENANFFQLTYGQGKVFGPSHFFLMTLKSKGMYKDKDWSGTHSRLDVEYYNHFQARQTLAWHFQAENIINPEAESQILLGGDTGLRGYQINQFSGNKLLLTNLENRFFVVDDILRFASLGTAAFFDAGYVWDDNKQIRLKDIKMNVGAGLRFHLTRTSLGHVLRIDVAYALNKIKGEDRLIITFGSSQVF